MFLLLIKVRLAIVINVARLQIRRSFWLSAGLAVLGAALFCGVFFGFLFLFKLASAMSMLREAMYQVFYFLFLFLLAGSTPFVAATLLQSSDYSILFAAPIPPRSVVAAKLVDAAATNALQFMVLGVPALVAAAFALHVSQDRWLLLPVLIALFVLIPALITAMGLLLLMKVIGSARLRSAITALNAIMATVTCLTIVMESPYLTLRPAADHLATVGAIGRSSAGAHIFPSAWFVDVLAGTGDLITAGGFPAMIALLKIVILVLALWSACVLLGVQLISATTMAEEGVTTFGPIGSPTLSSWPAGPVGALLRKDWQYLKRDSMLISQLGMPLILFAVPFILTLQDPSRRTHGEIFYFAGGITGVILFMQTSILSLSSLGLESRAYWIVLTSPIDASRLLLSKFLMSVSISASVGICLTLIAGLFFSATIEVLLVQCVIVIVSAAALSGLGVGLAAMFPRFVYENPAHRVSAWALILGFFASAGYVTVSGILFVVGWLVAINYPTGNGPVLVYGVASTLYLVMSVCAAYLPLMLGAKRIEGYQWEY